MRDARQERATDLRRIHRAALHRRPPLLLVLLPNPMSLPPISRRRLLRNLSWSAPLLLLSSRSTLLAASARRTTPTLTAADDALLEEIERATFTFFQENAHPETGLVRDRCHVNGEDRREVASVAATGFGLTALCIADQRRWLKPGEAAASD